MKNIILMISVFFIGLGCLTSLMARDGVEVEFTTLKILKNSQSLPLELTISNFSGMPVREVQVWHRWLGEGRFQMTRMDNQGFSYYAAIDLESGKSGIVEYYFAIAYLDNRSETYPSNSPAGTTLRTSIQTPRNYGDQVVIISPEPEEQLFASDIIITASFSSFASMVDVERSKMYLNTWDVTQYLQKYGDFVSFAPRTVPAGRHKIRLELYNTDGTLVASREWYFRAQSTTRGPEVAEGEWQVNGRVFGELRQEDLGGSGASGVSTSSLKTNYNQGGLQLRAKYNEWNFGGRVYLNNQEDSNRQPVNRYAGFARVNFWNDRYIGVDFGDTYPKFNPMILRNVFLRGVHARLFLKAFNFDFAYGKTRRGVEGTVIDSTTTLYGTYEREITSFRPSFGSGEKFQFGLTYLKGKDKEESIELGREPQENVAVGADLFLALDNKRIIIEGNFNSSAYNPNITGGSIPFDTLSLFIEDLDKDLYDFVSDYITVNQYLIVRPAIAYQGRLNLRYFKNNFNFIYESVDQDYYTLGQPYLLRDNRGFQIFDNINLFKNQVFLTLGYRRYENNLQNNKNNTTKNNSFYANLSYFPMEKLPEITIGFNNYQRDNGVSADSLDSILNRPEDNQTRTITVSGAYRFLLGELNNRFGVNLVTYQRDDIFKEAESSSDYLTVNFKTQFQIPLQTILEFILQQSETGQETDLASKLDVTSFGLGGRYIFTNLMTTDRLFLQAKLRFGSVKYDYLLAGLPDSDYSRNYYSFRVNYSVPRYGSLGLIADILSYGGNRNYNDFIYTVRYDYTF
jgi:hypothetical protein